MNSQAESALYSELDKLSAAWETLDRQVKSKVYDLSALEDRIAKAGVDVSGFPAWPTELLSCLNAIQRAKAENKFYAAMRDKEGVDLERKNLARNLDKAGKAVDKLSQSEKALTARMVRIFSTIVVLKLTSVPSMISRRSSYSGRRSRSSRKSKLVLRRPRPPAGGCASWASVRVWRRYIRSLSVEVVCGRF